MCRYSTYHVYHWLVISDVSYDMSVIFLYRREIKSFLHSGWSHHQLCPWLDLKESAMANKMPVIELVQLGLLLLLCLPVVCTSLENKCWRLSDFNSPVLEREGDIIIGGLFPLHYIAPEPEYTYSELPQYQECSGCVREKQ